MEKILGKKYTKCIQMDILIYQMSQGWFCSLLKEEKHRVSARMCVSTRTNALSHKRVSPCAAPDYGQRTACALRSMYAFALSLSFSLSPDMPSFFPLHEFSMTQSPLLHKLLMQKQREQKAKCSTTYMHMSATAVRLTRKMT